MTNKINDLDISRKHFCKIIKLDTDPVTTFEAIENRCNDDEKEKFWEIIEDIGFNGTDRERLISLDTISSYNKDLSNRILDKLIEEIGTNYEENTNILDPTVTMIWNCNRADKIPFILDVYQWAKSISRKDFISWCFSAMLVLDWQAIEEDLNVKVVNEDDSWVIDTLAYFVYENGKSEYKLMLKSLSDEAKKRAKKLKYKIWWRWKDNYCVFD
jgi:hypothetical protein